MGAAFGLVALAVFSRPLALIRMIETFGAKFAYVLTPTASSLQSSGQHERLAQLLLQAGRLGTALALPMILLLAVLGDPIMLAWMGASLHARARRSSSSAWATSARWPSRR